MLKRKAIVGLGIFVLAVLLLGIINWHIERSKESQIKEFSKLSFKELKEKIDVSENDRKELLLESVVLKIDSLKMDTMTLSNLLKIENDFFKGRNYYTGKLGVEINEKLIRGEIRRVDWESLFQKRTQTKGVLGRRLDACFLLGIDSITSNYRGLGEILIPINFYLKELDKPLFESDKTRLKGMLRSLQSHANKLIKRSPPKTIDSLFVLRLSGCFNEEGNKILDSVGSKLVSPLISKEQNPEKLFFMGTFEERRVDLKLANLIHNKKIKSLEKLLKCYYENPVIAQKLQVSFELAKLEARRFDISSTICDETIYSLAKEIDENENLYDESIHLALMKYTGELCEETVENIPRNFKKFFRKYRSIYRIVQSEGSEELKKELQDVINSSFTISGLKSSSPQDIYREGVAFGCYSGNFYDLALTGNKWFENNY